MPDLDLKSGVSIALMIVLLGAAYRLGVELNNIQRDLQAFKDGAADRYTLSAASENALREAMANPGHKVPDPRKPGAYIIAEAASIPVVTSVPRTPRPTAPAEP